MKEEEKKRNKSKCWGGTKGRKEGIIFYIESEEAAGLENKVGLTAQLGGEVQSNALVFGVPDSNNGNQQKKREEKGGKSIYS